MFQRLLSTFIKPSTRAFVREARRLPGFGWFDLVHGYVYGRWVYLYIGTGLGATRLAHVGAPLLRMLTKPAGWLSRLPKQAASAPLPRKTIADTYHGKVVTLAAAKQLVSVQQPVSLTGLEHIIPFEKARDLVMQDPDHIAVLECPCRSARAHPCLPLDVCLLVGEPFVSFTLEHHPQRSRAISSAEAVSILEAEHGRGHVHHAFFKDAMLGRFYAICNCCACCCGAMQSYRNHIPMLIPSGYLSQVDAEQCAGCGVCTAYCPFGAVSIGPGFAAQVDAALCMGCGVCVDQCDLHALSLARHPDHPAPLELEMLLM